MLKNVTPTRAAFFEVLAAHTDRVVAGANATLRLITGLGHSSENREGLINEVNNNEDSADRLKADFIRMLFESFTTPIPREQLHTLVLDLDHILDTLQSVANAIKVYNISASTAESRTMASLASDACHNLNRAIVAMADRNKQAEIVGYCREVEILEERASEAMREGVTKLFANEGDEAAAWHAMKMRRLYFTQEGVLDRCKKAARTIEEILIENA